MKKKITCLLLSLMLVVTLIPQISFAAEAGDSRSNIGIITGFAPLETSEYYYQGNPDENDLTLNLPDTLDVYLNGSSQTTAIEVTWTAVEDFEDTDFYYYSMKPVWGKEYQISSQLSEIFDVPWITVYKQDSEVEGVEAIPTEEKIESIYTEEEGPIDPEESEASNNIKNAAKTIFNVFAEESYADTQSNSDAIFKYLKETMRLNTAAASGVMANLFAESSMLPNNLQNSYNTSLGLTDDRYTYLVDASENGDYYTGSGVKKNFATDSAGYGLCQWTTSGRKGNLLYAVKHATTTVSVSDLYTQLSYLKTELESNDYSQVLATLQKVPENELGAYIAASEFCLSYEKPSEPVETAASRGKTCLETYWKTYGIPTESVTGKSFTSICGYKYPPDNLKLGNGMTVSGYAVSNYNIASVTCSITNSKGAKVCSKTVNPNSTAYDLFKLDDYMKFRSLEVGEYTYTVSVTDSLGISATASHYFKVSSSGSATMSRGFITNNGVPAKAQTTTATIVKKAYSGAWPKLPKRGYFKKGDKGTQVKNLQKYLKWYGYNMTTGGKYGTKTVYYVKKFQKAMKLKQDGKFGKKTLAKAKAVKK